MAYVTQTVSAAADRPARRKTSQPRCCIHRCRRSVWWSGHRERLQFPHWQST